MILLALAAALCLAPPPAGAAELKSRYTTILYDNLDELKILDRNLYLGAQLSWQLRRRNLVTVGDEVAAKIDILVEQVQLVLEMYPAKMACTVRLFPDSKAARDEYARKSGERVDFISFYSRREHTLYLSVEDAGLKVVAHELGHAVIESYAPNILPTKANELLAQYAAERIAD